MRVLHGAQVRSEQGQRAKVLFLQPGRILLPALQNLRKVELLLSLGGAELATAQVNCTIVSLRVIIVVRWTVQEIHH